MLGRSRQPWFSPQCEEGSKWQNLRPSPVLDTQPTASSKASADVCHLHLLKSLGFIQYCYLLEASVMEKLLIKCRSLQTSDKASRMTSLCLDNSYFILCIILKKCDVSHSTALLFEVAFSLQGIFCNCTVAIKELNKKSNCPYLLISSRPIYQIYTQYIW